MLPTVFGCPYQPLIPGLPLAAGGPGLGHRNRLPGALSGRQGRRPGSLARAAVYGAARCPEVWQRYGTAKDGRRLPQSPPATLCSVQTVWAGPVSKYSCALRPRRYARRSARAEGGTGQPCRPPATAPHTAPSDPAQCNPVAGRQSCVVPKVHQEAAHLHWNRGPSISIMAWVIGPFTCEVVLQGLARRVHARAPVFCNTCPLYGLRTNAWHGRPRRRAGRSGISLVLLGRRVGSKVKACCCCCRGCARWPTP